MERVPVAKLSHKEWRRKAKNERRRRLRTREARARDSDAKRLKAVLEKSAEYLNWLESQRANEELKAIEEAKEHDLREQQWLEEEVRAQKEWRIHQDRKAKARQEQLDQESRIRKEFEAKQEVLRLKKEEARIREEEESKRLADVQRNIDAYIDEGTSTPEVLRSVTSTQPGKDLCPFFSKTGACRYGDTCSRNHQRLALSKVLLIPGFYSHFSLEKNAAEYDTDVALEFDGSEMRQHFREFYNDVVPELETFGRIKTLKFCRNTEIHLRGNMYVEYYTEREAARALRSLKSRWYAGRQLNCEFTNLKSWRNAVCGMPKCPKGRNCNFLHTYRNPRDEYDMKSPPRSRMRAGTNQDDRRSSRSSRLDQESSRSGGWQHQQSREDSTRNWRWSESPDSGPESPSRTGRSDDRRGGREEQRSSRRMRKRHHDSRRSRNRGSDKEASEAEGEIEADGKSPRRKREEKLISRPKAKKKKKHKHRDVEAEEEEDETKSRGSHRNGKDRSAAPVEIEEKRGTVKKKDRSRRRDSVKKNPEKTEKTKWDDPNGTTDSESESTSLEGSKRRKRNSRKSQSPSWSEVDPSEVSSIAESEGKRSRTPHR